jgi:predicted CXXCH cytochrome family protein
MMSPRTYRQAAFLGLLVLTLCGSSASQPQSRIAGTKHNLSVSGPGEIRATEEQQVCVFCHTPHARVETQPLWNHELSTQTYTLYSSDYLTSLNYAAPNQPNPRSKLCLSCHDGTIAIGAVYNNGGPMTIEMRDGVTTMPAHAAGNLGTSLANDHPVGYTYDNTKDPELVARPWPWRTTVQLDPDGSGGTVECHTCHEPHNNEHTNFLREDNTNAALCTFCHAKSGWGESIHATSRQNTTPPGGALTTVGERACRNCHASHGGTGVPYLQPLSEENTCYAAGCHGSVSSGASTKNIQSTAEKFYAHPVNTESGKHTHPDTPNSRNVPNRHAECQDCHSPHAARKGLHTEGNNTVSNVLLGVPGVIPGPAPMWSQPTVFTSVPSALQENQICFTCHSYNGFGITFNGVSGIIGPSGIPITDQALEFNPANRSAHPVQVPANQQSGSAAPRSLTVAQMAPRWSATGTQTMYCSDCHGNDQQTSLTVPQGPHGADSRFMLTGRGTFWPGARTGELWSLNDITGNLNNWQTELFCANCHVLYDAGGFKNNVHAGVAHQGADIRCITCHVAVPHGAQRSRLIGYAGDPAPYNYLGPGPYDRLVIDGFSKANSPFGYNRESCSMQGVCHGPGGGRYEP